MKSENDERDEFWNIENMIPKRKNEKQPIKPDTELVEIKLDGVDTQSGEKIKRTERNKLARKIIDDIENGGREVLCEYKPDDNPYIASVKVYRWPTKYSFYERFVHLGEKYLNVTVNKCEYVPFYSYTPQYDQMSIKQLKYYIWWRTCFKKDTYIATDLDYICLYLYELINIDGEESNEEKLEHMAKLWLAYREEFPRIDKLIGEWMCDFCLIHRLPVPDEISKIAGEISHIVTLREFYSVGESINENDELCSFIKKNSMYDFTRSLLYNDKTKHLFDNHIIAAVIYAVKKTDNADVGKLSDRTVKMSRDSYSGALCVCEKKRRIEVEYYSTSRSYKTKPLITVLVKYSENKLREYLGAKSRLSATGLPKNMTDAVDEYYSQNLPKKENVADEAKRLENKRYEMYEVLDNTLDVDKAALLENTSWQTAAMLAGDEEEKDCVDIDNSKANIQSSEEKRTCEYENEYEQLYATFSQLQKEVFDLIYDEKSNNAEALCKKHGVLLQSVVDEINALAFEITCDIIIEQMQIIGDYKNEFKRN